jgi:hypothetical protein
MLWTNEPNPKKGVLPQKWQQQHNDLLEISSIIANGDSPDQNFFLSVMCRGMSQTGVYLDIRPYYKSFYNALEV